MVALPLGPCAQRSEVRSGAGLRETLAPDVTGRNAGQMAAFLLLGAPAEQGAWQMVERDHEGRNDRRSAARNLLRQDDLVLEAEVGAAIFFRPMRRPKSHLVPLGHPAPLDLDASLF